MARIKIQSPTDDGLVVEPNDQPDGTALVWVANAVHKYNNTGVEFLRIAKGAGDAMMKLHEQVPASETYGLDLNDKEITISANTTKIYGPYSPGAFNERPGATDAAHTGISFSQITGLMVSVIRPRPPVA